MPTRKITIEVPSDLLENAQRASGKGITETISEGLKLLAAIEPHATLRKLRGKVTFSQSLAELKSDRV